MDNAKIRNVFIIGSKSVGQYGGYETFVDKLTEYHQSAETIRYHITAKAAGSGCMDETKLEGVSGFCRGTDGAEASFVYHNAKIFKLKVPEMGPATAILYDVAACRFFIRYCRIHHIQRPVFYILACRIGPFIAGIKRRIRAIGGVLYINPDGHEWKRSKWSAPVRKYWKYSEKLMVRHADLLICDAVAIEEYIQSEYGQYRPRTTFIPYGSETSESRMRDDDPMFLAWLNKNGVSPHQYDLVVGRFVPENNYETMIREYMKSESKRKLVLITNENPGLYKELKERLRFDKDPRIVFAGPLYHGECLKKIRENAYLYLHGHSVGGTNPSLLEALGSTELNLLFDVSFNREVAENCALYWTQEPGDLAALLNRAGSMSFEERRAFGKKAKARIEAAYNWETIADAYEHVFKEEID